MTKKEELRAVCRKAFNQSLEFDLIRIPSKTGERIQGKGGGVDISSNGLGFVTAVSLVTGEILKLKFPSQPSGIPVPVFSEVRWAKLDENQYRVGVQFLS